MVVAAWVAVVWWHGGGGHRPGFTTVTVMWLLMTAAMMAPTAVPMLAALDGFTADGARRVWWAFLGGYLSVWVAVAMLLAGAQWWLARLRLVDGHGASTSWGFSAALVLAAGAYQFTGLKQRCLSECLTPMTFFWRHWRSGTGGSLMMGMRHGAACVGCCWALMLLAFVGGAMSIWFMVLGAVLMVIEKVPALGRRVSAPLGALLLAAGALMVVAAASGAAGGERNHHGAMVDRG